MHREVKLVYLACSLFLAKVLSLASSIPQRSLSAVDLHSNVVCMRMHMKLN